MSWIFYTYKRYSSPSGKIVGNGGGFAASALFFFGRGGTGGDKSSTSWILNNQKTKPGVKKIETAPRYGNLKERTELQHK